MSQYFGYQQITGLEAAFSVNTIRNMTTPQGEWFYCPGVGAWTVQALGAYVRGVNALDCTMRIAIYDSSGNIVAEGSAAKLINSEVAAWVEHDSLTISTALTGGAYYLLCISFSNSNHRIGIGSPSPAGCGSYVNVIDNTGGYPATMNDGTPYFLDKFVNVRVKANSPDENKLSINIQGSGSLEASLYGQRGSGWILQSAALLAPTDAPVVAAGVTGSLTGIFQAKFTNIDVFGNESNPSTASGTVSLSAQAITVTFDGPGDSTVVQRAIYLLSPSYTTYKFAATVSSSTSRTTYTVSVTDAQLGGSDDLIETNDSMPVGKYLAIFDDKLIVSGDRSLPDRISVSNPLFHRQFDPDDYARVVSGDGQAVKGFGKYFDSLITAKSDSYYITPSGGQVFKTTPHNPDAGVLGQPSIVNFLKRMGYFSKDGIYVETGNSPEEISKPIRHYIRKLNPENLTCIPPKQVSARYRYYKKLYFSVREASGSGENDTVLVFNWETGAWTKYKNIEATYLAPIQNSQNYEYLWGGDSSGRVYRFAQPTGSQPNADYHRGYAEAIDAFIETPWINLPRARGIDNWDKSKTEAAWLDIYAGGECQTGQSYITMNTAVRFDMQDTYNATYSTTHVAGQWPTVKAEAKSISFAGNYGPFQWVKFRFSNAVLYEHFKIHKLIFGFRARTTEEK